MREDHIDISNQTSNSIDDYAQINFDYIITVCDHANEHCPHISSQYALRLHHNFFDPSKVEGSKEEKRDVFLKARDEIKGYFENFCKTYLSSSLKI